MRISRIRMKNYRQYKDIDISFKKSKSHDIHLLIAKNGSGKSNFLNAITWCLYNEEPHLSEQNSALPIMNIDILEKMKEGEEGKLSVEIEVKNGNKTLYIIREKTILKPHSKKEAIIEIENRLRITEENEYGNLNEIKEDDVKDVIKIIFPEGLREYFFFDNEQLNSYFNTNKADSIKGSIHTISQISELERIKLRLDNVKRDYEKDLGKGNLNIDSLNDEIENSEKILKDKNNLLENVNNQIKVSEEKIEEIKSYLRGNEDIRELEKKEKEKENLIKSHENDLYNKKKEITDFINEYEVLIRLYPSIKELKYILDNETIKYEDNSSAYMSKELLKKVLESKKCIICNKKIDDETENRVKDLLKEVNEKNGVISNLEVIKETANDLIKKTKLYEKEKDKLLSSIKITNDTIENLNNDLNEIREKINNFVDKEKAEKYYKEKDYHINLLRDNNKKSVMLSTDIEIEKREIEKKKNKLKKLIEKDKANRKTKLKIDRIEEMSYLVEVVKDELIDEIKEKVRKETYENFKKLIWKKNTYKNVEIDDSYNVNLISYGDYSARGSCSAAETSLLALSFTLALHSISGFDAPLVIDSPVGRISDENRENFTKVLLDVSKNKEIILLFSPSEYSKEVSEIIQENYSSKKNIIVEEKVGIARIEEE